MIIRIKNLRLKTIIGVNPWERNDPQALIINCAIEFDGDKAGKTDDIKDTLDYRTITKIVTELVESSRHQLVETLAQSILAAILEQKLVTRATVEVDKPNAIKTADSTSVEVSGQRS